ncbi:unnamed protein product [Hapterophycus canaliculatus]
MLPNTKSSVFWECSPPFNGGDSPFPIQDQDRCTRAARKHTGVTDTVRGTPPARSGPPRQLPEQHGAINNTGHPTRHSGKKFVSWQLFQTLYARREEGATEKVCGRTEEEVGERRKGVG